MLSGNVPKHLVAGARTGFLRAVREMEPAWQRIANTYNMDRKSVDLVDLGATPMPIEDTTGSNIQEFVERTLQVEPKPWSITVALSHDAREDDQTGQLEARFRGAGLNFNRHMNKRAFESLNGGDGSTYGLCYDGQNFFSGSHVDGGGHYQTAQDNQFTNNLSIDNFETAYVAMRGFVDDQGEPVDFMPDLLVVNQNNMRTAAQICENAEAHDTANREMNPYRGIIQYVVSPYLDTNAWHLIASSETTKPLILVMREQPHLQAAWFDPSKGEGGWYMFKFYARYDVAYGDWRLAAQGQT